MSRKVLTAILVPAAALAAAGVSAASTSVQVPGSPFHGKRGHVRHATVTAGRPAVTWQIPTGSDAAAYWTPERMQSAQPYPMGRAGGPTHPAPTAKGGTAGGGAWGYVTLPEGP